MGLYRHRFPKGGGAVIVTQPKEDIGRFVALTQGRPEPWGNFTTIGSVVNGRLVAGVVYNNFSGAGCCAHIGSVGKHWLTREFLYAIFDYPFNQLQLRRITVLTARRNKKARKFVDRLGFKYEGCVRHALPDDDWIMYGMLREECTHISRLKEAA